MQLCLVMWDKRGISDLVILEDPFTNEEQFWIGCLKGAWEQNILDKTLDQFTIETKITYNGKGLQYLQYVSLQVQVNEVDL